ncbi:hypothetical protein [Pseudomonas sp. C9-3]|uniref:hypothetical protein n=1 Tax=Pseudomonas sp. C9-3 TaxID=3078264 RepID=UPI0028E72382|nr:hypothetical protein [Pseudomonas sp. C9-3]
MITRPLCHPLVRALVSALRGQSNAAGTAPPRLPEDYQSASLTLDFLTDYYATQGADDVRYPLPLVLNELTLPLRAAA